MNLTDYLVNGLLLALVIHQIHGKRLTVLGLLWPLAMVYLVGSSYLHSIPSAGNDLVLVIGGAAVGALLGSLCGVFTKLVPGKDGITVAKAGALAAGLWILGIGSRMAFELYSSHGGGPAIERFSAAHQITSANAWAAGLVLMALTEVVTRSGVLAFRARSSLTMGPLRPTLPFASGIMGRGQRAQ